MFIPKFGNIFNFCRIFAIYITVLTISRSVIWRKVIWEDGRKYANFMLILTIWSKKCKKNLSNPKFFSTFANAKVFCIKSAKCDRKDIITWISSPAIAATK